MECRTGDPVSGARLLGCRFHQKPDTQTRRCQYPAGCNAGRVSVDDCLLSGGGVVIIAVLQLFGFEATSLVAVLGATTLAIGLALQGTLSHVAAGVMLVLFRPYKLYEYVSIGGESGTVEDINLFFTQLVTPQNIQVIVPNGDAWGSTITNYSRKETRRLDITFGIDYDDDIDKAMTIILDVVKADERAKSEPEPWVRVTTLNDSSVDLQLRVWCNTGDYWEVNFSLLKKVKEAFDAGGITIPYPHQVEIHKGSE